MPDLLPHALGYAGLGLEIFPVGDDKRPLTSQHKATTDLDQIEAWWQRWPEALIGHRVAPDVVLLDVDPRHEGKATWAAIKASLNSHMPTTRTHLSGRGDGGGHIWFARPEGKLTIVKLDEWAEARNVGQRLPTGRWVSGIDILRHEHRYTILPPSPHPETGQPYRWARGKGVHIDPAPMPTWLAEMLTRDEPTATTPAQEIWTDPNSIADWFSATHSWASVLEPHGWTCVSGGTDADGDEWRHPEATTSVSATVRHGCLFVYSTSTPFEPTESGDPHGYTPFAAWAVLEHQGDQKAAGGAARRMKESSVNPELTPDRLSGVGEGNDTPQQPQSQETALQRVDLEHLEAFWGMTPELGRIRDFARARMCSPWAMLGVVLARVAAATPPFVVLPPIVGSYLSLNLYVCLVGGSGAGKDAAISAGKDAIDVSRGIEFRQIGLGSGEGILDQFVEYKPPDKAEGEPARIEQHTTSVLFTNPEIETVSALKGRSGATLMPMLRDAWMGSDVGFAYANRERRLYVNEHKYRLCLILGSQPTSAGVLLDESAVGTPQRFLWLPVHDPAAPDEAPDVPEMPPWRLPAWPQAESGKVALTLCSEADQAIRNARLDRLRGTPDSADGHALACQEKVGALLAILHGANEVTSGYWAMAGIVATVSQKTRQSAQEAIGYESKRRNVQRGQAEAQRQLVVANVVEDEAVQRVCQKVLARLGAEWVKGSDLRRKLQHKDRPFMDEAVERLLSTGQIESEDVEYRGQVGVQYRKQS